MNRSFVPVWVNIRKEPIPDLRSVDGAIVGIELGPDRRVSAGFSQKFFLRSVVLSPDGRTLLNPQEKPAFGHLFSQGHFPYAQVKADDYLAMLEAAMRYTGPHEDHLPRDAPAAGAAERHPAPDPHR